MHSKTRTHGGAVRVRPGAASRPSLTPWDAPRPQSRHDCPRARPGRRRAAVRTAARLPVIGAAPTLPAMRAAVYFAACTGEDIAKIGFSRDPLRRLQSLHARWFEFFDLDAGFVVLADSVREARRLERRLIVLAVDHRAPAPLTVRGRAGGHTEWFRGASPLLETAARALASEGFAVVAPLRPWLAARLRDRAGAVYEWSLRALAQVEAGNAAARDELRDVLDALAAFGFDAREFVAADTWQAWTRLEQGHGPDGA